MAKRGGLGRGLDALIPEKSSAKDNKKKKSSASIEKKAAPKINSSKAAIKSIGKSVTATLASDEVKPVKAVNGSGKKTSRSQGRTEPNAVASDASRSGVSNAGPGKSDMQSVVYIKASLVEPNRDQPRKYFDDEAIAELSDSIKQFGVISPLLVQKKNNYYEIIAGERRWRAAKKAGLRELPCIVREYSGQEAVEVSLIENIQREDLNPIEEAKAYGRLSKEYGLSQEDVARRVSKSRSAVTNSIRLLKLTDEVQRMVETGEISEGHARALLGAGSSAAEVKIAEQIVKDKLSVRQTEKLIRDLSGNKTGNRRIITDPARVSMLNDLANNLRESLGTKVTIKQSGKKRGRIEIEYYSDDELDRLYELLREI